MILDMIVEGPLLGLNLPVKTALPELLKSSFFVFYLFLRCVLFSLDFVPFLFFINFTILIYSVSITSLLGN